MIPNHILIVGSPYSGNVKVAQLLSKEEDFQYVSRLEEAAEESDSGLIIKTSLTTKYYSIKLNILVDEFSEAKGDSGITSSYQRKLEDLKQWQQEFISEEYEELREVLDGIIFTFSLEHDSAEFISQAMEILSSIKLALESDGEGDWPGFMAVVATSSIEAGDSIVSQDVLDDLEDIVILNGFEFVNFMEEGMNEYREKIGRDRVIELLETHEWSNMELKKSNDDQYRDNKLKKLEEMKTGLLEGSNETEITTIFEKLTIAKQHISTLPRDKRDAYANEIIDEIIDFI